MPTFLCFTSYIDSCIFLHTHSSKFCLFRNVLCSFHYVVPVRFPHMLNSSFTDSNISKPAVCLCFLGKSASALTDIGTFPLPTTSEVTAYTSNRQSPPGAILLPFLVTAFSTHTVVGTLWLPHVVSRSLWAVGPWSRVGNVASCFLSHPWVAPSLFCHVHFFNPSTCGSRLTFPQQMEYLSICL